MEEKKKGKKRKSKTGNGKKMNECDLFSWLL